MHHHSIQHSMPCNHAATSYVRGVTPTWTPCSVIIPRPSPSTVLLRTAELSVEPNARPRRRCDGGIVLELLRLPQGRLQIGSVDCGRQNAADVVSRTQAAGEQEVLGADRRFRLECDGAVLRRISIWLLLLLLGFRLLLRLHCAWRALERRATCQSAPSSTRVRCHASARTTSMQWSMSFREAIFGCFCLLGVAVVRMLLQGEFLAQGHGDMLLQSHGRRVVLGTLFALLAAVANGTFTIFSKMEAVRRAHVDPLVFNFWACLAIALTSFLASILAHRLVWTPLGLLSGLFFVVSAANAFRAVRLIGVSVGTGIWCGTAVVVSFLAGLLFDPHGHLRNLPLAIVGLVLIVLGICAIAGAGHMGRVAAGREDDLDTLLYQPSGENRVGDNFMSGVLAAVLAGILGGLVMLPMTRAKKSAHGLAYLPSFGVGVLVFAPIVTTLPYLTANSWPPLHTKIAATPGVVSGVVWNIGNALSILGILYVGYSVAYPIMQCGIFIAGLWGMLLFGEISGKAASIFWASGVLVVVGICLLAVAK